MARVKNITIPQPCHESWQQMSITEKGRYCDVCAKTIVDFNLMSNDDIITYLTTNKNVCARVDERRLQSINKGLINANLFTLNKLKRLGVAFSFLSLVSYFKASGQVKAPIVKVDNANQQNGQANPATLQKKADSITIKGTITDTLNFPIPDATIIALPGKEKTITNKDGSFVFVLPADTKGFTINYIEFYPQAIVIEPKKVEKYDIKLYQRPNIMGEVIISKPVPKTPLDVRTKLYNRLVDSLTRKKPK